MSQITPEEYLPRPVQASDAACVGRLAALQTWLWSSIAHLNSWPWRAALRAVLGVAVFSISVFLLAERERRGFKDMLWLMLWLFALLGSCVLWYIWSAKSKQAHAFQFGSIVFGIYILDKLVGETAPKIDGIPPTLPLGIISGSFMSSLCLQARASLSNDGLGHATGVNLQDVRAGIPSAES